MEQVGDFSNASIISEKIFLEELGFRENFWTLLVNAYIEEVPRKDETVALLNKFEKFLQQKVESGLEEWWFEYMGYFDNLIIEYLRLSFEPPKKTEEELLLQFRKSAKEGKTGILFPELPEDL